jgi:REP element-mobilizing transposase RayT
MARKLRLEFPGASYHVINRGNRRVGPFGEERTRDAFVACLFEACARSKWVLHAYVVMGNHFHLALETPEGNLATGMQWLQATFTNRYNRFRGEAGHGSIFQGRYKALVVQAGAPLGMLCDYIHLNPVRAGIVPVARLGEWRWSSYRWLSAKADRPRWLRVETALTEAEQFRAALVKDFDLAATARAWEVDGAQEVRSVRCEKQLRVCLRAIGRQPAKMADEPKGAVWKVAVAARMKRTTDASNGWLAERLKMGSATRVSQVVGDLARNPDSPAAQIYQQLSEILAT